MSLKFIITINRRVGILPILLLLVASICSFDTTLAQVNLELTSSAPTTPQPSGEIFSVRFQYRCASTVQAANQARLEVVVPAELTFSSVRNSPHIQNSGYDAGTSTAWFEFIDPLAAGTTGEVALRVSFENGTTPNGTVASLQGLFSAQDATSVSSSVSVTSEAQSRLTVSKYDLGQPGIGNETIYGFTICNGEDGEVETGTLNLGTLSIEDVLPATATFVSFGTLSTGVLTTNYDAGTHTANWTVTGLSSGECRWVRVIVRYDAPANSVGQTITNTVSVTTTPVGESPITMGDAVSHVLNASSSSLDVRKETSSPSRYPLGYAFYSIGINNTGTEVLNDVTLTDVIPYETEIHRLEVGEYADIAGADQNFVTFQYQTNLNSSWQTYSDSPLKAWDGRVIYISELGLTLGGPEYLTQVRFTYGDRGNTFGSYKDIKLYYRIRSGTPPGTITNCVTSSTSTIGASVSTDCTDFEILAPYSGPAAYLAMTLEPGYSNPFSVGDEVEYKCSVNNRTEAGAALDDLMGIIYFPKGSSFVPGSILIDRQDDLVGAPDLEYVENFDGDGNSILRIKWSGSDGDLGVGQILRFTFKALIGTEAVAGPGALEFKWAVSSLNSLDECSNSYETDVDDLDGDANTSEDICFRTAEIDVSEYVAISSELAVKGSLDTEYSSFPEQGETLPGGLADYRLTVVNQGNVNLRDFTFLDIFPQVGDVGIIDPQARNSAWRPNLVGPVDAPSGVVVYYSTASNPCRAVDGFLSSDPSGCQAPNWTIVPPADITSVNSIKVEFGSTLIAPKDTLVFEWPMRTPTDVLSQPGVSPGDLAYNSTGFIATVDGSGSTLLPSEPVKTGLAIRSMTPGVFGDRVWSDTNGDGIQDFGEVGVNNVRVELYEDNGDGIADTSTDTYVGFTSTAGDGNYLFPNLPSGNYFAFFSKPPTFSIASKGEGLDPELDSDGIPYTSNGIEGAISDVVGVTNVDFNFSIDLGLEPTGLGAIGDYVWNDANADGIQDEGVAAGINGISVELLSSVGVVLATTQTSPDEFGKPGYFFFDDLAPGSYSLRLLIPAGVTLSASGQGGDSNADSDGDPADSGATGLIVISANTFTDNIDFGLQLPPAEICDNGFDDDGDGFIDCLDQECPPANPVVRIDID